MNGISLQRYSKNQASRRGLSKDQNAHPNDHHGCILSANLRVFRVDPPFKTLKKPQEYIKAAIGYRICKPQVVGSNPTSGSLKQGVLGGFVVL